MVMSPTAMTVALLGRTQVSWNSMSWSRVMAATDSASPDPVNGMP